MISYHATTSQALVAFCPRRQSLALSLIGCVQGTSKNRVLYCARQRGQTVGILEAIVRQRGSTASPSLQNHSVWRVLNRRAGADAIMRPVKLATLKSIYVCPAYRRQGVARGLISTSVRHLQKLRVSQFRVAVDSDDTAYRACLDRLGFSKSQCLMRKTVKQGDTACVTPPAHVIRTAGHGDIPQLGKLVRLEVEQQQRLAGCFELHRDVDWQSYTASLLSNRSAVVFVAEQAGELVGYVQIRRTVIARGVSQWMRRYAPWCAGPSGEIGLIEDVYVVEHRRKSGFATALMRHAVNWLRQHEVIDVKACVWAANGPSRCLFQKLGFQSSQVLLARPIECADRITR